MILFLTGVVCLAVGFAFGMVAAAFCMSDDDSECINHLEEFRLILSNFEGRWAVFQTLDGKQVMIGQSHETARGALVAARSAARG